MKYLVYYDDVTGSIEDSQGYLVGTTGVQLPVPKPVEEKKGATIDDIIKMKASGFTADDIVKMGFKL